MNAQVVEQLTALGRFPAEVNATDSLATQELLLTQLQEDLTAQEINEMCRLFGPDTYFGLAWRLLHILETSRHWDLNVVQSMPPDSPWKEIARDRLLNKDK